MIVQKLLYGSVLPTMADQLDHVDSTELVLPSFIALIKRATVGQYQQHIRVHFNRVFKTTRSVQASVYTGAYRPCIGRTLPGGHPS